LGTFVSKEQVCSDEAKQLLAEAQAFFVQGDSAAVKSKIQELFIATKGVYSRDAYRLLAAVAEQDGQKDKALSARYLSIMTLGGESFQDYSSLLYDLEKAGNRDQQIINICKRALTQRFQVREIYEKMAFSYLKKNELRKAVDRGLLPSFLESLRHGKPPHEECLLAVQYLEKIGRFTEACTILERALNRCFELNVPANDDLNKKYAEILLTRMRDFRGCAEFYLKLWQLAKTGDPQKDAVFKIPEGWKLRKHLGARDFVKLAQLATALIRLGRYDEVDATMQYARGSREGECAICVEAVNVIEDLIENPDFGDNLPRVKNWFSGVITALVHRKEYTVVKRMLGRMKRADLLFPEFQKIYGEVFYLEKQYSEALEQLEPLLEKFTAAEKDEQKAADEKEEQANLVAGEKKEEILDQQALRVLLAEIYTHVQDSTAFARVLQGVGYSELQSLKRLPQPMSLERREALFFELRDDLQKAWTVYNKRAGSPSSSSSGTSAEEDLTNLLPKEWGNRFAGLVYDCELDEERAGQAKQVELENETGENFTKKARAMTIRHKKRSLGLASIEDVYSSDVWLDFVRFGCFFGLGTCFQAPASAVELLELCIFHRKRHHKHGVKMNRKLPELEQASMALALEARLSKIVFKYIRTFMLEPDLKNPDRPLIRENVVALFARLVAANSVDFLDQRSTLEGMQARVSEYQKWLARHLCNNPTAFTLLMFVAHCSSINGRHQVFLILTILP